MAYNTMGIVKDVDGKPVPQYFNKETDRYEVANGSNGYLGVMLIDSRGREISSTLLADKLDELIKAVK